jgi:uncharacterized glyoxalase superfamily protein PhnB
MARAAVPDGYHCVTPYLVVEGAARLLEFLKSAFGAEETLRLAAPEGRIGHAEARIGDSVVMTADAPTGSAPMPATLHLYVADVDATYRRALDAGATSLRTPEDQFYGDRNAGIVDPAGNRWWIATHIEDLSREELAKRAEAAMQRASKS